MRESVVVLQIVVLMIVRKRRTLGEGRSDLRARLWARCAGMQGGFAGGAAVIRKNNFGGLAQSNRCAMLVSTAFCNVWRICFFVLLQHVG